MLGIFTTYIVEIILVLIFLKQKLFIAIFCIYVGSMAIPYTRFVNSNIVEIIITTLTNAYYYIKDKRWKNWTYNGIEIYFAGQGNAFGCYKSASVCKRVERLKKRYPDVEVISNMHFTRIEYTPLTSMEQIGDLQVKDNTKNPKKGYILVMDELGRMLNSRDYRNFPPDMLSLVTQLRKNKVLVLGTAGDMDDIDVAIRKKATYIYECEKHNRYLKMRVYRGREYERHTDKRLVPYTIKRDWFTNKDLNGYDTDQMQYKIGDLKSIEELSRVRSEYTNPSTEYITNKQLKKQRRKK